VPSILNASDQSKNCNEDEAAFVDSFFLPGGLFSDESNNVDRNKISIINNNNSQRTDSLHGTTTSPSSTNLPKNPWESEILNSSTAHVTKATPGSIARIESSSIQPFNGIISSTKSNHGNENILSYDGINFINNPGNITSPKHISERLDDGGRTVTEAIKYESSLFQQRVHLNTTNRKSSAEGKINSDMTSRTNNCDKVLRPPPGFQKGPNLEFYDGAACITEVSQRQKNAAASTHANRNPTALPVVTNPEKKINHLSPLNDNDGRTTSDEKVSVVTDGSCDAPVQTTNLADVSMTIPSNRSKHNVSSPRSKSKTIEITEKLTFCAQTDNNLDRNSMTTRETTNNFPIPKSIGSEEKSRELIHAIKDEDYNDDIDVQEEEISIPSNICLSIGAESNSSSLSTCSEVDNNSESSSIVSDIIDHVNDHDGCQDDTDQVSQIVGAPNDNQSMSPTPSLSLEGETQRFTPATEIHRYILTNFKYIMDKMMTPLCFTAQYFDSVSSSALSAIRSSSLHSKAKESYELISRNIGNLSQELQSFTKWLMDVEEVFGVLLIRVLAVGRMYSGRIIDALVVILSFVLQIFKFGLIEAIEEFSAVTSCYIAFYLVPKTCVVIMKFINLPHWMPHTITWLAIFSLCNPVDAIAPNEMSSNSMLSSTRAPGTTIANTSHNSNTAEFSSTKRIPQICLPQRQHKYEASRARDKQICFLLLKTLKTTLPILFMVEGFSSEFGIIIGKSGTNQLTTAFLLSIIRNSIITSPVGWISWAVQILLADYISPWICLDIFILLIGLSSIRLIRFLDLQRLEVKQR